MTTPARINDLDTANRRYAGLRAASDRFQTSAKAEIVRLRKEAAALLAEADGWQHALDCFQSLEKSGS